MAKENNELRRWPVYRLIRNNHIPEEIIDCWRDGDCPETLRDNCDLCKSIHYPVNRNKNHELSDYLRMYVDRQYYNPNNSFEP